MVCAWFACRSEGKGNLLEKSKAAAREVRVGPSASHHEFRKRNQKARIFFIIPIVCAVDKNASKTPRTTPQHHGYKHRELDDDNAGCLAFKWSHGSNDSAAKPRRSKRGWWRLRLSNISG